MNSEKQAILDAATPSEESPIITWKLTRKEASRIACTVGLPRATAGLQMVERLISTTALNTSR